MLQMLKNGHGITIQKDRCLFTAKDFHFFLSHLDELSGFKIYLRENIDNSIQIIINQNCYTIWSEDTVDYNKEFSA